MAAVRKRSRGAQMRRLFLAEDVESLAAAQGLALRDAIPAASVAKLLNNAFLQHGGGGRRLLAEHHRLQATEAGRIAKALRRLLAAMPGRRVPATVIGFVPVPFVEPPPVPVPPAEAAGLTKMVDGVVVPLTPGDLAMMARDRAGPERERRRAAARATFQDDLFRTLALLLEGAEAAARFAADMRHPEGPRSWHPHPERDLIGHLVAIYDHAFRKPVRGGSRGRAGTAGMDRGRDGFISAACDFAGLGAKSPDAIEQEWKRYRADWKAGKVRPVAGLPPIGDGPAESLWQLPMAGLR
jgi:hypothetical protein